MNRIIVAALATLMVVIFAAPRQTTLAQSAQRPEYSIDAIRFATLGGVRLNSLLKDAPADQKMDVAAVVWLIRGGGHTILFDTGYHKAKELVERSKDYITPDQAVREAGVDPANVTDVIISHAHNDHMDGLDLFPNAMIWIQQGEYEYYTKDAWQPGGNTRGVSADDVIDLVRRNIRGQVHLISGDGVEIFPGITVYTGARHTFASQYIRIAGHDPFVLASDNCYLYENLQTHRVSGSVFLPSDEPGQLAAMDRMVALAGSPDRVIPGHDALQFQRYPTKGRVAHIR